VLQAPPSWCLPLNCLQFIDVFPASEGPKLDRVSRCDVMSHEDRVTMHFLAVLVLSLLLQPRMLVTSLLPVFLWSHAQLCCIRTSRAFATELSTGRNCAACAVAGTCPSQVRNFTFVLVEFSQVPVGSLLLPA